MKPHTTSRQFQDVDYSPHLRSEFKSTLLPLLISNNVLSFGTCVLKSRRESPYFFTSSLLRCTFAARLLRCVRHLLSAELFVATDADGTARPTSTLSSEPASRVSPFARLSPTSSLCGFPSGKTTWDNLSMFRSAARRPRHMARWKHCRTPLKGKRVLIVDDVVTAGTALPSRLSVWLRRKGSLVAGVVYLLDRKERIGIDPRAPLALPQRDLGGRVPISQLSVSMT
ncbi:hypothetical protein N7497_012311 [Penicillium chrysogenum]|nr:hypothetical protein N7497_012311 [Penicillium chrysogenum]